jgi:ABC-type nitrate/sulfonate/bicarbonate transport system permease component
LSQTGERAQASAQIPLVGAVVGEILAGDVELGVLITRAVNRFNPNLLMATIFLTT